MTNRKSLIALLLIVAVAISVAGEAVKQPPSTVRALEIQARLIKTFGADYFRVWEDQTGYPSCFKTNIGLLKSNYGLDLDVINYCYIAFSSKASENMPEVRGSFLVIQPQPTSFDKVDSTIRNTKKKTRSLTTKKPYVANVSTSDSFVIVSFFEMAELSDGAKRIITAINDVEKQ